MKAFFIFLLATAIIAICGCSQKGQKNNDPLPNKKTNSIKENAFKVQDGFVMVIGGAFKDTLSNLYRTNANVNDFIIGKYEVTQKEWTSVMGNNPSHFKGNNPPVEMVNWYDCVEYCNERSKKEGLKPYYIIDKKNKDPKNKLDLDNIKWTVTISEMPTVTDCPQKQSGSMLQAVAK